LWFEFDENIDGIIEAGSCSWILSKDIETYGIVKLPKRIDFIKNKELMMSEDHEYNESEDEAIVTAAKAGGTADEVLMGMRICVKVAKN
jgi:hypothetical protein